MMGYRVGEKVICTICGKKKAPVGRSISDLTRLGYCDTDLCRGYWDEPKPDTIFEGEKCTDISPRRRNR